MQAYQHHCQLPKLLALVVWTEDFYPKEQHYFSELWKLTKGGFQTEAGQWIAGLTQPDFHIFEFQHTEEKKRLKLQCIRERILR